MKPNALQSLYGAGHANATRTRECVAMPGMREQTVFTPRSITDIVRLCFGTRIAYDPCHGEPGVVLTKRAKDAGLRSLEDCVAAGHTPDSLIEARYANPASSTVDAVRTTTSDGITAPWVDGTFCNPPYGKLKEWAEKSMNENCSHIMLVPLRPHRKWYRKWASTVPSSEMVYLDPVKFVGHAQAFPSSVVLAWRNCPDAKRGRLADLCLIAGVGGPILPPDTMDQTAIFERILMELYRTKQ